MGETEDAWDDRVLIKAYEKAVQSYRKGGVAAVTDDVPQSREQPRKVSMDVRDSPAQSGLEEADRREDGAEKLKHQFGGVEGYGETFVIPEAPPPPPMPEDETGNEVSAQYTAQSEAEALEAMLNASYWAGYSRGVYDQIRRHRSAR